MIKKFVDFYQAQDAITFWSLATSIIMALFIIAILLLNINNLPSHLPLFYSNPWGESQLASLPQFIILPAIIFLTILINLTISWHLHPSQYLLKRMLATTTTIIAVLILITAIKIIYIFI